jgi:hypothetical protein
MPYHPMRKQRMIEQGCNKGKISTSYYSNIHRSTECVLTGVCYDYSLLLPIYDFLNARDFKDQPKNYEALLKKCFLSLKEDIDDEVEHRKSDEAKIEDLVDSNLEYEEDGTEH